MMRSTKKTAHTQLSSPFGRDQDEFFMNEALGFARQAAERGEVPIGAVVVNADGIIIGSGYNATEECHTQSAHAEIRALAAAGSSNNDWRLTRAWLYVTLEPCFMCMGLIYLSRLAGVVYGAQSPLFGGQLDSSRMVSVYKVDTLMVIGGVCAAEASDMLKAFFKKKRSDNGCS
jgi:tRNA(adenine34) deaminase